MQNITLYLPCRLPLFVEVFSLTLEFQPELKAKQLPWIGLKNCVKSLIKRQDDTSSGIGIRTGLQIHIVNADMSVSTER